MSSELGWMLPTSPRTRPKPAGAGSTAPGPHLCLQLLGRLGHQLLQRCLCRLLLLCLQLLHHLVLRGPGQRDGRGRLCFQEATQWGVPCPPPQNGMLPEPQVASQPCRVGNLSSSYPSRRAIWPLSSAFLPAPSNLRFPRVLSSCLIWEQRQGQSEGTAPSVILAQGPFDCPFLAQTVPGILAAPLGTAAGSPSPPSLGAPCPGPAGWPGCW